MSTTTAPAEATTSAATATVVLGTSSNMVDGRKRPTNVYQYTSNGGTPPAAPEAATPGATPARRQRHYAGSQNGNGGHAPTRRHTSILSGIRGLISQHRHRSESLSGEKSMVMRKVNGCNLESVYDLREQSADGDSDFYDDDWAFRRPRSNSSDFLILRKTSRPMTVDVLGLVDQLSDPYRQYMKVVDCYELAPHTGSVVALDSQLPVERALRALHDCNVGAGLVWVAEKNTLQSMVTFTDLFHFMRRPDAALNSPLREALSSNQLASVYADTKLWELCEDMRANRVHRVAVRERKTNNVLYLITSKRVLQAVHKQNRSLPFAQWLKCRVGDAQIGRWSRRVYTVGERAKLVDAVRLMLDYRLSSLPVVSEDEATQGKALDVVCKADLALFCCARGVQNVKETLANVEVRELCASRPPRAHFCRSSDTMGPVLDALLAARRARAFFVLDDEQKPIATMSLSDFIEYLLNATKGGRNHQEKYAGEEDEEKASSPLSSGVSSTSSTTATMATASLLSSSRRRMTALERVKSLDA